MGVAAKIDIRPGQCAGTYSERYNHGLEFLSGKADCDFIYLPMLRTHFECHTQHIQRWVKPINPYLFAGAALDLTRSKAELILENAFLRQRLIVLNRQVKRPAFKPHECVLLVRLTSVLRSWKQALAIGQPDTLLRWHSRGSDNPGRGNKPVAHQSPKRLWRSFSTWHGKTAPGVPNAFVANC